MLPLSGPRFNPLSGNWDPTIWVVQPTNQPKRPQARDVTLDMLLRMCCFQWQQTIWEIHASTGMMDVGIRVQYIHSFNKEIWNSCVTRQGLSRADGMHQWLIKCIKIFSCPAYDSCWWMVHMPANNLMMSITYCHPKFTVEKNQNYAFRFPSR